MRTVVDWMPSGAKIALVYDKKAENGYLSVVELPPLDIWEELEEKELSFDASSSEIIYGSFVDLMWMDVHILLGVSPFGLSHSSHFSQSPSNKDMLHGYYLQDIELWYSEDHVPGLRFCSRWHAEIARWNRIWALLLIPQKGVQHLFSLMLAESLKYIPNLGIMGEKPGILKKMLMGSVI